MIRFLKPFLLTAALLAPLNVLAADEPTSIEDLLSSGEATPLPDIDVTAPVATSNSQDTSKKLDIGRTGLPIPRFVSLKRDKVNVRKGPNESFDIAWTYTRQNLPVEIIAEYDNWRKVRDHQGSEGWVFHSLLSGSRYALVKSWETAGLSSIHNQRSDSSKIIANLEAGSLARIQACDGTWCQLNIETYQGHIKQEFLWGIYPGDSLK